MAFPSPTLQDVTVLGTATAEAVDVTTDLNVGGVASVNELQVGGTPFPNSLPSGNLLANVGSVDAGAAATPLSTLLDLVIANTQGEIIYRSGSAWVGLAPGAAGQVLKTGGTLANPSWVNELWNAGSVAALTTNLTIRAGNSLDLANSVTITGTLAAARFSATGLVNGGTVQSSGALIGNSASITTGVTGATVTATGLLSGGTINTSGLASVGTLSLGGTTGITNFNPAHISLAGGTLDVINFGTGSVTSIVAGTNLSGGTIGSAGTIALAGSISLTAVTTSGLLQAGSIATAGTVDLNSTGTTKPTLSAFAPTDVQISKAAGASGGYSVVTYAAGAPSYAGTHAGGTPGSPSATTTNMVLNQLIGFGHDGTTYATSSAAYIQLLAQENWTPTAQGTAIDFATTQIGTTTRAIRMRLYSAGRLFLGSSLPVDDGINAFQVNGGAIATFLGMRPSNNLTATGSNQATALGLTTGFNVLGTVAASTGVVLPAIGSVVAAGDMVLIDNAGSNAAKVYGSGAQTIDGVAGATGVTLTNAKRCIYIANTGSTWLSYQLGVPSA